MKFEKSLEFKSGRRYERVYVETHYLILGPIELDTFCFY